MYDIGLDKDKKIYFSNKSPVIQFDNNYNNSEEESNINFINLINFSMYR